MHRRSKRVALAIAAVVGLSAISARAAVSFSFTSTGNLDADAGFAEAGALWSSHLGDHITVNITAGFSPLNPGVLAQAGSTSTNVTYSSVKSALGAEVSSTADNTAYANLQSGSSLDFYTNNRAGTKYRDNNANGNNNTLRINRANAKALGLLTANATGQDASITFSSNYAFDFDRSDGIDANKYDFVGVAAHEIGHALGFVSGVDLVDYYSGFGPGAGTDLNGAGTGLGEFDNTPLFSVLDLYRYSSTSIALNPNILDLSYGGNAFFSIDGGTTNVATFSTGAYNGNGDQASHWEDGLMWGVMDPSGRNGELLSITSLDLTAFDVIGYNLIPEPAALGTIAIAGLLLLRRRRSSMA